MGGRKSSREVVAAWSVSFLEKCFCGSRGLFLGNQSKEMKVRGGANCFYGWNFECVRQEDCKCGVWVGACL